MFNILPCPLHHAFSGMTYWTTFPCGRAAGRTQDFAEEADEKAKGVKDEVEEGHDEM